MPQEKMPAEFVKYVSDAYEHLYDLVHLRNHPLTDRLAPDPTMHRKDKAWQLQRILLDIINELDPGSQGPAFSREWRRHRLMTLYCVDGLDSQAVANQLAISRRHFYRELGAAVQSIATILWDRYPIRPEANTDKLQPMSQEIPANRLELLQLETARLGNAGRTTDLDKVIEGVLGVLQLTLQQHQLGVQLSIPDWIPDVAIEKSLLRQMILGLLGYLIEGVKEADIHFVAQMERKSVNLSLQIEPPLAAKPKPEADVQERLSAFEEMAAVGDAQIQPIIKQQLIIGFEVLLPVSAQPTIFVVDDNEDILQLFRRYLIPHQFHVITAKSADDIPFHLIHQLHLYAFIIDLMMPDRDGWDLLQQLRNDPDTQNIPVVVCSVLKQKELALMLGATAFIEKPMTEDVVISVLESLAEA